MNKTLPIALALITAGARVPWSAAQENRDANVNVFPAVTVPAGEPLFMPFDAGVPTWDIARVPDRERSNIEFPHLARFRNHWYCSFREGLVHGNHISGRARVIRSADGVNWETAALFESETGDVRDPRLSVTPDGQLMLNASIRFIPEAAPYEVVDGQAVERRSVTWLSPDGDNWSGPHACPTGINTWRWDVAWHEGYGYSIGYSGRDRRGALYRTRDGITWEPWLENIFPGTQYSEAALTFGADGTAYCLLRGNRDATLGTARPPYNSDWTWRKMDVLWHGSDARRPFASTRASELGGPNIITLTDGRLLGAARANGATIFLVDPREATMTRLISVQGGGSYPGLAEHDGRAWFTYCTYSPWRVYLASAHIPGRMAIEDLAGLADEILVRTSTGFGARYRRTLANLRAPGAGSPPATLRDELHRAVVACQSARKTQAAAEKTLGAAAEALVPASSGFQRIYRDLTAAAGAVLKNTLEKDDATIEQITEITGRLAKALDGLEAAANLRVSAEAALHSARDISARPETGFGRLYQGLVGRRAKALRELLDDPRASVVPVAGELGRLREALGEFLEAGKFPVAPAIEVTGVRARVTIDAEGGLLVNTRAEGTALTLAEMPVLAFAGGNSWVNFGNPAEIAGLSRAFTVSAWAYPESTESAYRTILIKGAGPSSGHNGFFLRHGRTVANENHVSLGIFAYDDPQEPYGVNFRPADPVGFDHRWHHYAFTFDGSDLNFYIDGERVDGETIGGEVNLSEGDLSAGRANREPWRGYISDIRVWNAALDPERVRAEMSRRPPAGEPDLAGCWPLDEGAGERARDISGHENHGVINGAAWRSVPARAGRRISGPFRFPNATPGGKSSVTWRVENETTGTTTVRVLAGLSDHPDSLPEVWPEAVSGDAIPGLAESSAPAERFLWVRQELASTDPAIQPRLADITVVVE